MDPPSLPPDPQDPDLTLGRNTHSRSHHHQHSTEARHSHEHAQQDFHFGLESHRDEEQPNEDDIAEEVAHYEAVVGAFAFYSRSSGLLWRRLLRQYLSIPDHHRVLLEVADNERKHCMAPQERIQLLNKASQVNARFISLVLSQTTDFLNNASPSTPEEIISRSTQPAAPSKNPLSGFNAEKVHSTLYQLAREWSSDGKQERQQAFEPILAALEQYLPVSSDNRYKQKVFCPGSGLGRLPLEICFKGYSSLANEFSYFMLIMSNFMLNKTKQIDQFTIYPWIHQVSNVKDTSEQLREVRIPDVDPSSLPPDSEFGCAAGDFLDIAKEESQWDAVVTCFFIDTAHNVIEYMESIFGMLRPGGIWINLGPLLYHYTDSPELSLELTLDQVLHVAKKLGFDFQEQRTITCNYTKKHSSMMHVNYEAEFWVAKKPKS